MLFNILNRFSGSVQLSVEIGGSPEAPRGVLMGLAVRTALNTRANLYGANLSGANLSGANLSGADLSRANLSDANLSRANLSDADLSRANLSDADLSRANLSDANLYGADLSDANLSRANLYGANLYGANLPDTPEGRLALSRTRILPAEGAVIGWKKCQEGVLVKLRVPEEAKRSHAFGRKCRAEFAEVLEVIGAEQGRSIHNDAWVYRKGETVRPDSFDEDWREECAPGIHFFITREEAEAYH